MSRLNRTFDANGIYNELKTAIDDDKKYWLRNEAKIRASTTSRTYDEFREIVAAAHLSSVTTQDKKGKYQANWNTLADNRKQSSE